MLSPHDRKRYARHLLLAEIGPAGQARLLAQTVALPASADARAAEVAVDYLRRAGVTVGELGEVVALPDSAAVRALAGRSELHEATAALLGAFAAVEAIKSALAVGAPGELPASLTLCAEPLA